MPEGIGDILKSGGFTEAVQTAATQATTPPVETPKEPEPATQPVVAEPIAPTPPQVSPPDPAKEYLKKFGFENEEEISSLKNEVESLRKTASELEQAQNYLKTLEQEYGNY